MRKKVITSAVIILILSIILLLINHYKGHNSFAAPEITLVYAENQVEDYPTTKGAYEFARLVNERTNGRIKIVVKCNGELGDEKSVIEQLKFGGIDFSRVSISSISDDIPALKVIQMPFLYSDAQEMLDVLNGKEGTQFVDAVRESNLGVRALSWYDAGARSFYSVKPVTAMQDLQGLNIRVQESELMSETIEMLGANPVKMTYSEVYKGLQTGKIARRGGIRIVWSCATLYDGYQIYRATSRNAAFRSIVSLNTSRRSKYFTQTTTAKNIRSTYIDVTAKPEQTYYYKIVPYNRHNSSNIYGTASDIGNATARLMAPVLTVRRKKNADGQRYLRIKLRRYQGRYADIYIRKNHKKYTLLQLRNDNIKQQKATFDLHYTFRKATIAVKVQTFHKKKRTNGSFYSKEIVLQIRE